VKDLPPATVIHLAESLAAHRLWDKAIAVLQTAHQQYPDNFWINHKLAWHLENTQPPQWQEAGRYFAVTGSLRPRSPACRLNLGVALAGRGSLVEAKAAFERAIGLAPNYASAYNNLGLCALRMKNGPEAVKACRQAVRLRPKDARYHCNLGNALDYIGARDEA